MPVSLVYRTDDNSRWGGGQGSDLSATVIDLNFWTLWFAIQTLEDAASVSAGIDYISQPTDGDLFFVHLTDHRVLGPFKLPSAQWKPRGVWLANTGYQAFDTVQNNGQLYLVTVDHMSGATFSPFSTDGLGNNLYVLILEAPSNALPIGGTVNQRLVKASADNYITAWSSDRIRLAPFIEGQPNPGETVMQYVVADNMTLPAGLVGSTVFQGIPTSEDASWLLFKNGDAIGSIDFSAPSPEAVDVTFPIDITFVPGDVLTLVAPGIPDTTQANVSFTLVALLT